MRKNVLKIISDAMSELHLNYRFMEWKTKPIYPYFTGEYQESEPTTEDGFQESTFILNGFTRESWEALEDAKESIQNYFNKVSGKTVIAEDGSAVAVFYLTSTVIPTGDAELKRIQINLEIKEWSVN